jgi:hypothetical protein
VRYPLRHAAYGGLDCQSLARSTDHQRAAAAHEPEGMARMARVGPPMNEGDRYFLLNWRRNPFNNDLLTAVERALKVDDKDQAAHLIVTAVLKRERDMAAVKRGPMGMSAKSQRYPAEPFVTVGKTKFVIPRSTIGLGQRVIGLLERLSRR